MAEKKAKQYDNIIDAILDEREPDWKELGLDEAQKSGDEWAERSHQYVDTDFEDEIEESATSKHTPVWGPKSGHSEYEERIAAKEKASPRVNSVKADWRKDARRDEAAYNTELGDNDSLMNELTMSLEKAQSSSSLSENTADKKEVSDEKVFKYVRDLLNQGVSPSKVAAKLQKLAEIELFNHQSATDYLQRNAGLMGLAYLEPNTFMQKNSPKYERTASKTADEGTGFDNVSFKVSMNDHGHWISNSVRFATEGEAQQAGEELSSRWSGMPSEWKVEPSAEPVNYRFDTEQYRSVPIEKDETLRAGDVGVSDFDKDETPSSMRAHDVGVSDYDKNASSNACVQQKKAWDRAGVKPQAHSVKQVKACNGCTYFNKDARSKTCNLYHLPVIANEHELTQIVNHLTPGVPVKQKHAALVSIANGDGKRAQAAVQILAQTELIKTADAKVSNQSKRASYGYVDNRETSKHFESDHVAKMHQKGASLEQIYKWASEKFGDVDTSFAFRGFVQSLKKNAKGRVVVASADLKFLNSIGIRNEAYEGGAKCASCDFHKQGFMPTMNPMEMEQENMSTESNPDPYQIQDTALGRKMLDEQNAEGAAGVMPCSSCDADPMNFQSDENGEVYCGACGEVQPINQHELELRHQGSMRVNQKFASTTPDALRTKRETADGVVVTAAKVRTLHQAGHSVKKIYNGAANKVGSVQAKKAVAGFIEEFKKNPGKIAVSESDRAFLVGKLGFKPEAVRMLDPQRRPVTQVVASVPEGQNILSYPGMGKQAGAKKAVDGHSILAEYDLTGPVEGPEIDISGPKRDDIEMNDHFGLEIE